MLNVNEDQDHSHDASLGDLTTMTIDSLRTRLLSERAISRSAKQRADDLAKRVVELEEQLRIVSIQRKKAEKATVDVLAILESNGISDDSNAYDSCSDREMSVSESKLSNESARRKEGLNDFRERRNDQDTYSSSEIDSSSTAGSLSWKSRKDSLNYPERKKNIDSIRRRCSSFGSSGSLPTRLGKSCRRNRRKETRAQSVELRHDDSVGVDHQNLQNSHGISTVTFKKEPEKHKLNDLTEPLVSEASGTPETEVDTASLFPRNEHAQDLITVQAQQTVGIKTEWKDKLKENNGYVSESLDPDGSIVTENRDEIRVQNESVGDTISTPSHETQSVSIETGFSFKPEIITNPPDLPLFNNGQKSDTKNVKMSKHENSSSDIALPRTTGTHGQVLTNGESSRNTNEFTSKPEKSSNDLSSVLNALQLAKLSLKDKLSMKSVSDDGFSMMKDSQSFIPVSRTSRIIEPFGCPPELFRLPVDYQFQNPSIAREQSISSPYQEPRTDALNHTSSGAHSVNPSNTRSRTYTNTPRYIERESRIYTGAATIPPRIELRSGMYSSLSPKNIDFTPTLNDKQIFPTERSTYLDPRMNVGYPFSSTYTYHPPSYPSSSDVTPQLSLSNRFSSDAYGVERGMPSNAQIRHNMYK